MRGTGEDGRPGRPIHRAEVAGENRSLHGGHRPRRMDDLVLQGAPIPLPSVAPVVLSDELRLGGSCQAAWSGAKPAGESTAARSLAPCVFDIAWRRAALGHGEPMSHWDPKVRLVIGETSHPSDGRLGDEFANEHHGAPQSAVRHRSADVEAEVDLFEVPVERYRPAEDPGIDEPEPDYARQQAAVESIQFGPGGH